MVTKVRVSIDVKTFSPAEEQAIRKAALSVEAIINSDVFVNKMLAYPFHSSWNKGLSNAKLIDRVRGGAESLKPAKDYIWDVHYRGYWSSWFRRRVIGYTYPNTVWIWLNRRNIPAPTVNMDHAVRHIVGNMVHEYMHKLGFGHSFRRSSLWPYTVPYGVQRVVTDLYARYSDFRL